MQNKVLETDTHIYFLTGPFSQWSMNTFKGHIWYPDSIPDEIEFVCAEQYMMASKAMLFGDVQIFEKIMKAKKPDQHKDLGRMVQNFNPEIWNEHAQKIVMQGNYYRSQHSKEYMNALQNSGTKTLVEGSRFDKIWGVGLSWDDPKIQDENNWLGTNWLGKAHMVVRDVVVFGGDRKQIFG